MKKKEFLAKLDQMLKWCWRAESEGHTSAMEIAGVIQDVLSSESQDEDD
jgi:hypothetical protein